MRAVLADFERRGITYPDTPEDRRMAQVVIDQTRQARAYASYLPSTTELPLAPILAALQREPGDKRGAAHWAATAGITERTLLRHCQQHLGMSFNDWRQRLRVVSALGMLDAGLPVQDVARRLGYSTPSAFIAMFQRLTGESPDSARRRGGDAPRASPDIARHPPPLAGGAPLRTASSTRPMQGMAERATIAPDSNPRYSISCCAAPSWRGRAQESSCPPPPRLPPP